MNKSCHANHKFAFQGFIQTQNKKYFWNPVSPFWDNPNLFIRISTWMEPEALYLQSYLWSISQHINSNSIRWVQNKKKVDFGKVEISPKWHFCINTWNFKFIFAKSLLLKHCEMVTEKLCSLCQVQVLNHI